MARQSDVRTEDLERLNTSQLLRMPYQAFIDQLFGRLAVSGFEDIHPAHAIIFQHVGAGALRATELAERAQLTKQYVGRLVGELEGLGYLERIDDPSDGRARLVRLSERGRHLTDMAERIISEIEVDWARRVGPARHADLRRLLVDLAAALSL